MTSVRLVAVSDVHGEWERITMPDGDVLIVAGDLCEEVPEDQVAANDWIASLPHRHKLYIPGNHDLLAISNPAIFPASQVLIDRRIDIGGVTFYGAPWPSAGGQDYERLIQSPIDVLVTHEPPFGIRDWSWSSQSRLGNRDLLNAVRTSRPRVHIFGHCHDAYGCETRDGILYANVSTCDRQFQAAHRPVVIDVTPEQITVAG